MDIYTQNNLLLQVEQQNKEKAQKFKDRIKEFENVDTLEAAKQLASQILRISSNEKEEFKVGNATCVIINKEDSFRISYDSAEEFISYDFV